MGRGASLGLHWAGPVGLFLRPACLQMHEAVLRRCGLRCRPWRLRQDTITPRAAVSSSVEWQPLVSWGGWGTITGLSCKHGRCSSTTSVVLIPLMSFY